MHRKPVSSASSTPSKESGSAANEKVLFRLVRDEDDYPPFDIEGIWCTATDETDLYIVNNIPFFAKEATIGDTIRVRRSQQGELEFDEVVARSTHSLLRVVIYDQAEVQAVRDALRAMGCPSELQKARLIAVDVPDEVELADVQRYLDGLAADDRVGVEEPILRHPRERSLR